jgi:Zn finger protein HypA/HybF involved in hydrogenase expression
MIWIADIEELPKVKWVKTEIKCGTCGRHLHQQEINKDKTDVYYCTGCKSQQGICHKN